MRAIENALRPNLPSPSPLPNLKIVNMSQENRDRNGVGMRFDNYPNDVDTFNWILAKEGCHPSAAKRILKRIKLNGYDLLTVMSRLNFDIIVKALGNIGVRVTFIDPQEGWSNKFKDGTWPKELLDKIFKK